MSDRPNDLLAGFKQQLVADKKKSALLAVLFGTLLLVVGSLFLSDSTPEVAKAQPNTAAATTAKPPPTPPGRSLPRRFSKTTGARPRTDHSTGSRRPSRRHQAPRHSISVAEMPRGLHRDLFNTTEWSKYPPAVGLFGGRADGEDQPNMWDALAKAIIDHQKSRTEKLARLAEELAQMELQSTMTGATPMAYISGRLVHPGDTIRGFSVVRIDDRRVTLRQHGVIRELAMP